MLDSPKCVLPCLPEMIPQALKCRHFHTAIRWCFHKRGFPLPSPSTHRHPSPSLSRHPPPTVTLHLLSSVPSTHCHPPPSLSCPPPPTVTIILFFFFHYLQHSFIHILFWYTSFLHFLKLSTCVWRAWDLELICVGVVLACIRLPTCELTCVAVPDKNQIFCCVFRVHHWVWCAIALSFRWGWGSYALRGRFRYSYIYIVRMSPTLSGSSAL